MLRSSRLITRSASRSSRHLLSISRVSIPSIRLNSTVADVSSNKYAKVYNSSPVVSDLKPLDSFQRRHLGPNETEVAHQLKTLGYKDLDEFVKAVVPANILVKRPLKIEPQNGFSESQLLAHLKSIGAKNNVNIKTFIGKGYYGTIVPPVIQRNLFEAPEWYTSYTPYQPEISQGRLESLLNYQTVVADLTGLPVANASLLDEGTAAAEAMILSYNFCKKKKPVYVVDANVHPQTMAVVQSRANTLGVELKVLDLTSGGDAGFEELQSISKSVCGVLAQYPASNGTIYKKFQKISDLVHANKGLFAVATDLLALTLIKPPSSFGADIALGSSQRFGVPLGYGGPHAGFLSVVNELNRKIPGRIVGVSKDRLGNRALRLALQTREQHIKREKATSNICTAQALLANMASNYAVYHGPDGLKKIAQRVHIYTSILASYVQGSHEIASENFFDTLTVKLNGVTAKNFLQTALADYGINLYKVDETTVSLSLDETIVESDLIKLIKLFSGKAVDNATLQKDFESVSISLDAEIIRDQAEHPYLTNPVFNKYHSETSMMRYLHSLQAKDLSLADSMITLGSCTMKLNSAVEMIPVSWPEFSSLHPFVPKDQAKGYEELIVELEKDLADITGFDGTTLMPNSGAQGEYTGLTVIKSYLDSIGETDRNICLIPVSAHGTNPASATMAGLKVVAVKCNDDGSLNLPDLEAKAKKHAKNLACVMITYPSTYGLFEPGVRDAIDIVHANGGQVYLDGANMNAQVGLTSPGDLGADVCHLNLHKTFAIPHGGGGPGVGPICVKSHLMKFLPGHPLIETTNTNTETAIEPVNSAPFGSASILPISYAYIKMMGATGLPYSSVIAMLNANYMMKRLEPYYEIMFIGKSGLKHCAHEFIIDLRKLKAEAGVEAIDVAKRLQDYGFHAPTMSFPVANTLMIEPTESENLDELNRFVDSLISIRKEIDAKMNGDSTGNVLLNAPHSLDDLLSSKDWESRGYSRELAGFPLNHLKNAKSWPSVCRVNDTYGDMHLLCTCPSVEEVAAESD
ncbi:glycine decarboxylase subunit P [Saccharomycopsis crataegensis]|uniref:Glycine cleavage system P protein n=1 Tax=Saccharomycopsis crataegensis TaxID=43959 RepID=A0AAV5QJ15_9ASCO|nr:glycine decarboxylase subunit P [Saccharomycopsis crataegensis]